MGLNTQSFSALVTNIGTAIQGAAATLVDMTVGSVVLAIVDATATVIVWLESLLLQLLAITRASTSIDGDLDSWLADFGFTRLPGATATGQATFARYTATQPSIVPVGASIQSADGSLKYTVIADPSNVNYNATQNGYPLAAGQASVSATVQAVAVGAAYNAQPGQINTMGSPMPGVDTVTNPNAFITGANKETDTAVRGRFVQWIASLTEGTVAAIGYAITQVLNTAHYVIVENQTYAGAAFPGYFYVVVDDGSGNPPQSFLSAVTAAVNAVRPVSVTFNVYPPALLQASYTAALTVAMGYDPVGTKAAAASAVTAYINALPLGTPLPFSRLAQVVYDASPGITNVTGAALNGSTADMPCTPQQVIRAGSIVFP